MPALTPAETERLALVAEECGEVVQAVGKILRHGFESGHPQGGAKNRELLEMELGHLSYATHLLCLHDTNREHIDAHMVLKSESIGPYLHHQDNDTVPYEIRPCAVVGLCVCHDCHAVHAGAYYPRGDRPCCPACDSQNIQLLSADTLVACAAATEA